MNVNKKVLIIGGTGILSTDVCRQALKEGYEVFMFNRGTRSYNIESEAKLIICDVRKDSVKDIRKKIEGLYFDVVIDFLSMTVDHVQKSFKIIREKCDQYILISTATVYEKSSEDEIITEKTPIGNAKWDYSAKKVRCEKLVRSEYANYCKHYSIIRPYVTYSHTRIPYAIIPGQNWTFINRIKLGKPVLIWNHGEAICTITNTKDFAVGVVGVFMNPKAYGESFHITSDFRMTWKEVLEDTIEAIGMKVAIADKTNNEIVEHLPEYAGVLYGDKGTNMMFDNSKIKATVPEFNCKIPYREGVKNTIEYYLNHKEIQIVDYDWEGRIDWYLANYCYKGNKKIQEKLTLKTYGKLPLKSQYHYLINRYPLIGKINRLIRKA